MFGGEDIALLEVFARHAAIAIDNARRYDQERRRAARFALIARVTATLGVSSDVDTVLQRVADAVHEVLGFANVDIPLIDPEDPTLLLIRVRGGQYKQRITHEDRIPITRGIMGAAVREGRTQCINDVRNDPRYITPPGMTTPQAEIAIPIIQGSEVLGVLNVESDQVFDALDVASLEIIASHLAVAIENARLVTEVRAVAARLKPDLLMSDFKMPDLPAAELVKRALATQPQLRVLMFTSFAEYAQVKSMLDAGAHGYLLKDATRDDIRRALNTVAAGASYLHPLAQAALQGRIGHLGLERLTERERDVLLILSEGLSNKEIARKLDLTEGTVKA